MLIPSDSSILYGAILVCLPALLLILLLPKRFGFLVSFSSISVTALATSWLALQAILVHSHDLALPMGSFTGEIPVRIDSLSAWFILIVNFTVLTGMVFGSGYLKSYDLPARRSRMHWILLLFFHLSMLLVCMVQHGFAFLVVWEIMSLTSMLLVMFEHDKPDTFKAALNYFVQMHVSVTFLSLGVLWIYHQTGSFSFDTFPSFFASNRGLWISLVFFAGFGIKAGFIPFHSWLPHAHPAAPAHVSGIMSGVIVKLGIYGILRVITFLQNDFLVLGEIILTLSVLTGLYGILNASLRRDVKRMLAYCTIENIGIIGAGIGTGLIGTATGSAAMYYFGYGSALLHTLNHSLYKSMLFYSSGSVYQQSHTLNMEKLGGLIHSMPRTGFIFLTGALAICGLPPFNGFVSEFLLYNGMVEGIRSEGINLILLFVLSLAGLSIIGGISIIAFTKTFGTIFLGQPRAKLPHNPVEVSVRMLVPQFAIILVMLSIAFFPQLYFHALRPVLASISPMEPDLSGIDTILAASVQVSLFSLVLVGIIGLLMIMRRWTIRTKETRIHVTWGCGYVAPGSRQQYTGKSFSKSLGKIFNMLVPEKKVFSERNHIEIFPAKRSYHSQYADFFEENLIRPFAKVLIYPADFFRFIQNGRIQTYVLYGILFILVLFILSVFKIVA